MMERLEYKTKGITIIWQPKKCIHAGICVKQLPQVYNPKARPWITADNASFKEIQRQIEQCPSGALSYILEQK